MYPRSKSVQKTPSPLEMFGGGALVENSIWLYPDFHSVMVGQWSTEGHMKFAQVTVQNQ